MTAARCALWNVRPLDPTFGIFELDALKIVSRKETIGGSRCILLEAPTTVAGRVLRYWVATDKEMSVVRYAIVQGGVESRKTDVSFRRDPLHGWLPERWQTIAIKEGATFAASKIVVTKCTVNVPVPAETFEIKFPPRTKVFDSMARKTYVVRATGRSR